MTARGHSRREVLGAAAAAMLTGAKRLHGQTAPVRGPGGARTGGPVPPAYQYESQVWVRLRDVPFTCYRSGAGQKYPYFYPVLGPSGRPFTEEAGHPFPHHRSLFFGCDHVNGANYWQDNLKRGQIVSRGVTIAEQAAERVVLKDACDWKRPGDAGPVLQDERTWTLTAPSDTTRVVDAEIRLTAVQDIVVSRTNHSLFSVRAVTALTPLEGGRLLNAAGDSGEKGTFGVESPWCGFFGTRCGQAEAIVLMDHPMNLWAPTKWFTRDYGFISPTPLNWLEKWELPKGESVRLRYRVLVIEGPDAEPASAAIKSAYSDFARA